MEEGSSGKDGSAPAEPGRLTSLFLASFRHPRRVLVVALLVTLVLGAGIPQLESEVNVLDALPKDDPNTLAARNMSEAFKSGITRQVTVLVETNEGVCLEESRAHLPHRRTPTDCGNITDEVYVRAMEEMRTHFIETDGSPLVHAITAPDLYKLLNWTAEGGVDAPDSAFSLPSRTPAGEQRYAMVHESLWRYVPRAITGNIGVQGDAFVNLFMPEPHEGGSLAEIGQATMDLRESYVEAVESGQTRWTVFGADNPPQLVAELPVVEAHASNLAREDFSVIAPAVLAFVLAALYLGFRSLQSVAAGAGMLGATGIWVLGAMGWTGIPISGFNLAILPILLGSGIDYTIHLLTEFQAAKAEGEVDTEAARRTAQRAGPALAIATATTVTGLLLLVLSPSPMVAQVGALTALAITTVFVASITLVPAILAGLGRTEALGGSFRPSKVLPRVRQRVAAHPVAAVAVLGVLLAGALVSAPAAEIASIGDPAFQFTDDDPVRQEHVATHRSFFGFTDGHERTRSGALLFEGDLTDPRAHAYMDRLDRELREEEGLDMRVSRSIPFVMRTWLTVKNGIPGAGAFTLQSALAPQTGQDPYPDTREEIRSELDQAMATPLATFGGLFFNHPADDMGVLTLFTRAVDHQEAKAAWDQVWAAVERSEEARPPGLQVAFVGATASEVLIVEQQLPWLTYLGIATVVVVTALVAALTRDGRSALAVGAIVGLTSMLWLGVLPLLGVELSITLLVPAVFISALGSDYAVHMVWGMRRSGDPDAVFRVVGKALVLSALTDAGAFLVVATARNVPTRQAMLASAAAALITLAVTTLVISLLYMDPDPGGHAGGPAA